MCCSIKHIRRQSGVPLCLPGRLRSRSGQTTVEAAFLIPILFVMLLMLMQPAILLYNQAVMENAAGEGCRLIATGTGHQGQYSHLRTDEYIKRRLAAIPPVDFFHAHVGDETWHITREGGRGSGEVTVLIINKLRPLPLIGLGLQAMGKLDENGYMTQSVELHMPEQPRWLWSNASGSPSDWWTK